MMQELAARLRQAGSEYFPASARDAFCFADSVARLSVTNCAAFRLRLTRILETVAATPGIHRKDLAEKLDRSRAGE